MLKNWDDYAENEYINQEGRYLLKIIGFEEKTTANDKVCHVFSCENIDHEKINVNLYLVDKAMWKYKMFVKACGVEAKGQFDTQEFPKTLIGKKFIGEVRRQPDRTDIVTGDVIPGKYMEVKNFYPREDERKDD